jgi:hypothetical protein
LAQARRDQPRLSTPVRGRRDVDSLPSHSPQSSWRAPRRLRLRRCCVVVRAAHGRRPPPDRRERCSRAAAFARERSTVKSREI